MKRIRLYALLLALAAGLSGQIDTATLGGTVIDPAGGVLPDARVHIESPDTGFKLDTRTGPDGRFRFSLLDPGGYSVTVQAPGFNGSVIKDFELSASEVVDQSFALEYETASFQVETTASALGVRIQTAEAQISRVLTLKELDLLPQLGRDPLQLAVYSPGVLNNGGSSRFNGTRNGSTNTQHDGIDVADPISPRFGLADSVNIDSVSEVRLILNGGKAEYGRNAGAQIELVTRRGSNHWSGNLYEYLRNTVLDANGFFNNSAGVARPKLIQNIFGASLGGPVIKNKTFFFVNFEDTEVAQEVSSNRVVLTPEARSGIFRWLTPGGGAIQSFNIVANDPRRLGIDPAIARELNLVPLPNNTVIGDGLNTAGYLFNNPDPQSLPAGNARIDHVLNARQRLMFRYSQAHFADVDAGNGNEARYPGMTPGQQFANNVGFSAGWDWTISPSVTNEMRTGLSRYDVQFYVPRVPGAVVVPNTFFNPDFSNASSQSTVPNWQLNDNLSWVKGRHTVKSGISLQRSHDHVSSDAGIYPNILLSRSFGNTPPSSIGPFGANVIAPSDRTQFELLYNDLLGRVSNINQTFQSDLSTYAPAGTPSRRDFRWQDWGLFLQDDWRINRKLILNIGLRYELFQVPIEENGLMGTLDRPNATLGFAGITDFTVQRASGFGKPNHHNFAPRFGFAYDPFGTGKTAIRGSFGVFYERGIGQAVAAQNMDTPGFSLVGQAFPNLSGTTDIRFSDKPAGPTAPAAVDLTLPVTRTGTVLVPTDSLVTPYFLHWNFSLQREILRGTVVEAAYVATRGIKLGQSVNVNQKDLSSSGFLADFLQLQAFQSQGTPVPATNSLVKIFGTPQAAINNLGASNFLTGAAGTAAENLDRGYYTRYAGAGLPQTYLRLFPQFVNLYAMESSGRSYFDSLQLSLRCDMGWLRTSANYMFSKNIDTIAGDNGSGTDVPMDRFNFRNGRGNSTFHIPHSFNMTAIVQLPYGWGRRFGHNTPRWLDAAAGGWNLGFLARAQTGFPLSVVSSVDTYGVGGTLANYSGGRIGSVQQSGDGVRFFTPDQLKLFSTPAAGQSGGLSKDFFRGPFNWNMDTSLVKQIPVHEGQMLMVRLEAYNTVNTVIFANPAANINIPQTFGRISGTVNTPRIVQVALRYEF